MMELESVPGKSALLMSRLPRTSTMATTRYDRHTKSCVASNTTPASTSEMTAQPTMRKTGWSTGTSKYW